MFVYAHIKLCYRAYTPLSALKKNKKTRLCGVRRRAVWEWAPPPGLEPRQRVPKTRVLPLHHGGMAENLAATAKCLLCHMSPTPRVSTCRTNKKRCLRCTKSVMRTLSNGTRFTYMGVTPQTCGTYAKHARATRHQANRKPWPWCSG